MNTIPIALQMYTLRKESHQGLPRLLKSVAEMGYQGVEFAGYGGLTAPELKRILDDLGLKVAGSHVTLDELDRNLNEVIEYNKTLGNHFIVCPFIAPDKRGFRKDWQLISAKLDSIGRILRTEGIELLYHNHDFEFETFDGEYAFDIILNHTSPEHLRFELDVYWVEKAGESATKYLQTLGKRCAAVHVKDMEPGPEGFFAEVGEGILDIPAILRLAEVEGVEWFIVEQDDSRRPPLESVQISIKNLRKMGY